MHCKFRGLVGLLAVWLLFIAELCHAKNSYIFIAPNVARPGREFSIQGELLKNPFGTMNLVAELKDGNSQIARTETTASRKQGVNLDLSIPPGLKPSNKNLRLTITGSGGLTFSSSKTVEFEDKSVTVYIQTDKYVYKPGQMIRMRIFGTTPELTVVEDKLKVEIHDPKGNKINQWDISGAELRSLNGVFITQQVLSEYPILGEWKIKAKLLSYTTEFTEKIIKVEEYVLPKFEVELDLPPFGRTKDTNFEGKVKAKYTFGKPVKGEANLLVEPKTRRFTWKNRARVDVTKTFGMKFPINGEAKFTIPMSDLKGLTTMLSGSSLIFKVNVTEKVSKLKQPDEQELSFYSNPMKVEFPKSLANTFKPEMTYDVVIKVSLQDGTPPEISVEKLSVTIDEYEKVEEKQDCWPRWKRSILPPWGPCGTWTVEKKTKTYTKKLAVPLDGIVSFPLNVNKKVTKVVLKASINGATASYTVKKRHSPSDSFIQITTRNSSPQAGDRVRFTVRSTKIPGTVNYQVYSKGAIVKVGTFSMNSKTKTWFLSMTSLMAPRSRILVYYIRTDGEVVADSLTINVQGIFKNKVTVQFNDTDSMPADMIQLKITADAQSSVNVLAVDKSVLLLGTGNDITTDQVIGEVNKFDTKSKKKNFNGCDWFCWRWPLPSGGEDVKDVFDESGVIVLTDANVYEHREVIRPRPRPRPMPWFRRGGPRMMAMDMAGAGPIALASAPRMRSFRKSAVRPSIPVDQPTSSANLAPVQKVRKLFPETWLWTTTTVQYDGVAVIEEKIPDTITSWIASAFAIHPQSGLGLSLSPAQLQVSMPFFMMVTLPYSVVRGEKVILQVNLHNYAADALYARVELAQSSDFDNIEIVGVKQTKTSKNDVKSLTVAPNEVVAVYFPIVPTTIGRIKINVKAQTPVMADSVVKELLVEAEGTPREKNFPVLIDLEKTGTYTEKVKVDFPIATVGDSERVTATVIGDIMGPSLKGLAKLLKMPYGCGEQNMLKFAPNIFIVKYLEATKNLNEKTLKEAKEFMEKGYQRELTYSHPDGSYSAFGERDDSGSTWLTAFVVKSFVQAKPYIFIDDDVIIKAVDWLIKQQAADGTFNEPGRVIHKEMQGGSTAGKVSLTSYVLIALLEARVIKGVSGKIQETVDNSQRFLEGKIPQMNDVYDLAIGAYALQLAGSIKAQEVYNKLDAKAIIEVGTKHWEKSSSGKTKPNKKGKAVNVELTAYALLTLAEKQDRIEGVKVLKWLTKQRNSDGGFYSTQDTVVALQGLSEMAALVYRSVTNLDITISATGFTRTLRVDNTNALLLQKVDLPSNINEVTVTGTGVGLAIIQVGVFYNIHSDDQKDSFMLKVNLPGQDPTNRDTFEVEACASWLEEGSSSMAVMEIGFPSGFAADPGTIISTPKHKRVETETRKLVLYFDEIGPRDTCVTLTMARVGMVAGARSVPVHVYDYYEPGKQVTEFYLPDAIKNSDFCDICGTDCDFCSQ